MAEAILWKGIKPPVLRIDAVRLTLLNSLRKVATPIKRDFEATVRTWDKKPKFEREIGLSPDGPTLLIGTDDENYNRLDKGTRPHLIKPRADGPGFLRFQPGYTAKTSPGVIGSRAGGPHGDFVYAMEVNHPGTEPRLFGETIQKKWKKPFKRAMEQAMKDAAKSSRWGKK